MLAENLDFSPFSRSFYVIDVFDNERGTHFPHF